MNTLSKQTEIDLNECEHFLKANLGGSKLDRFYSVNWMAAKMALHQSTALRFDLGGNEMVEQFTEPVNCSTISSVYHLFYISNSSLTLLTKHHMHHKVMSLLWWRTSAWNVSNLVWPFWQSAIFSTFPIHV